MTRGLFVQAMLKFVLGVVLVGLLLFWPAGTIRYWNGWLLMGILFVPMFFAGVVLMVKNPELLKKRLNTNERQAEQRRVVKLSGLMFIIGFVSAGLNVRYGWIRLPDWVSWVAAGFFLCAYLLYGEVLRENAYLSRTVEVQENQRVIDAGLYGVVRHPMYGSTVLLFLSMPWVLGSPVSAVVFLAYPFILAMRIFSEEAVLERELEGYARYKQKVKYKLIPYIW